MMGDADDLYDDLEEYRWVQMRERGIPEEDIARAKRHKQWREDVTLYSMFIKQQAWEYDPSCSLVEAYLRLCSALEGLVRRPEAIRRLYEGVAKCPHSPALILALAKLLFKDDQKEESLKLCRQVFEMYAAQQQSIGSDIQDSKDGSALQHISDEDAEDAYYLGGWVKIHDDDHTEAYRIWRDGALAVPSSTLLSTQYRKRECWDEDFTVTDPQVTALVGSSARHRGEPYTLAEDFDFFVCYDPHAVESSTGHCAIGQVINAQEVPHYATPALAIFGPEQAQRGVVFRTRHAVLTAEECRRVVDTVNRYHDEACDGHWGTVRHSSVKTTDVAVESVPLLREWLLALMHTKTNRMLSFLFPALADGTSMYTNETPSKSRIRIHDAFIVRYDAERDHSLSLPEHCDTSAVSVVVSLNSAAAGDYTGGGTWFEALGEKGLVVDAEVGQAVAFAGPLKHAGYPITQGVRMILVLFLYVEGYHYGPYLTRARQCSGPCSGDQGGDSTPATSKIDAITSAAHQLPATEEKPQEGGEDSPATAGADTPKLNSGGEKGGFVVYRQTVELVNMLEKSLVSAL